MATTTKTFPFRRPLNLNHISLYQVLLNTQPCPSDSPAQLSPHLYLSPPFEPRSSLDNVSLYLMKTFALISLPSNTPNIPIVKQPHRYSVLYRHKNNPPTPQHHSLQKYSDPKSLKIVSDHSITQYSDTLHLPNKITKKAPSLTFHMGISGLFGPHSLFPPPQLTTLLTCALSLSSGTHSRTLFLTNNSIFSVYGFRSRSPSSCCCGRRPTRTGL